MGDHLANGSLLLDHGAVDAAAPEALGYEQRNHGM
jgi:hypothetical protein